MKAEQVSLMCAPTGRACWKWSSLGVRCPSMGPFSEGVPSVWDGAKFRTAVSSAVKVNLSSSTSFSLPDVPVCLVFNSHKYLMHGIHDDSTLWICTAAVSACRPAYLRVFVCWSSVPVTWRLSTSGLGKIKPHQHLSGISFTSECFRE